jgi:hypothetical protein
MDSEFEEKLRKVFLDFLGFLRFLRAFSIESGKPRPLGAAFRFGKVDAQDMPKKR